MTEQNRDRRREEKIQVLSSGEPLYPARLKEIKDYPKTLYYIGDPKFFRGRRAAVVGSRTTTAYGRNTARAIGRCLAGHDVTVVSGMAAGIDTCAHNGALREPGGTIAVLGCGADICYPSDNRDLRDEIAERGLLLSEYPPGTQPRSFRFPQRNRIISGISEIVVVVQARIRSGALITAELAAEQGREVLSVPGNIDSIYHRGTNRLICDGAAPIAAVEDVLAPLGIKSGGGPNVSVSLSGSEREVYGALEGGGEMGTDELCARLRLTPAYILPILSALELKGLIYSEAGKFFLANP